MDNIHNLQDLDVAFVQGDIRDLDLMKQVCRGVETVFHLAAMVSVPESMVNEPETVSINTIGTLNLLKAATTTS